SLRFRLAVAMFGVVLLCTVVCVAAAVLFLNQTLTDRANSEVSRTLSGVSGYLGNQRSDLLGTARLVADQRAVIRDAFEGNRQDLVYFLTPMYADLNADIMDVVDAHGRVLVRMEDTLSPRTSLADRASVRSALAGTPYAALEQDLPNEAAGGFAYRVTVPIFRGPRVVGAVIVGRRLDSNFAARIRHAVDADISLVAGDQITGTTVTDSHGLPLTGAPVTSSTLSRIGTGRVSIATQNQSGQTVLSGLVPLRGADGRWDGAIEVIRPLTSDYNVIKLLSLLLAALGAVVVVAGTALALAIARRLTSRLQVLEATASSVASMAGTDATLGRIQLSEPVGGHDEVTSLGHSFSAMMSALDQRLAANRELYSAAQARVRELSGLAEVARLLTAVSSVEETIGVLGEQVCRIVGVSSVAIWLPGSGNLPALLGGHGLPDRYEELSAWMLYNLAGSHFESVAQTAMRTGNVSFRRLLDDQDVRHPARLALYEVLSAEGWTAATAVPLRVQGRVVGALTCYTVSSDPLPASDLSLLVTIADQVAVAVENARLAAEAQAKAALEERLHSEEQLREKQAQYQGVFEATSDGLVITEVDTGVIVEANPAYCRMHGYTHDEIIGLVSTRVVHSSVHPDLFNLQETIASGGEIQTQGLNVRKDGSTFPTEVHGTGFMYNGKIHVLAVVRDITERVQAYELLEQRVVERTKELSTLLEVSHSVAGTLELQPLLELILDQVKVVAGYDEAAIIEWKDGLSSTIGYRGPLSLDSVVGGAVPLGPDFLLWQVISKGQPLLIGDIRDSSPEAEAFRQMVGNRLDSRLLHITSWLGIPLILRDQVIGLLALSHQERGYFTERHATLSLAIANQAAVAIENARLYQQAQEVAVLEERQRLARELHDSVSQALYGIALGAKTARSLAESDPARVVEPLEYVLTLAEAGLNEMRALIFELRPESLESEGLVAALEKQVAAIHSRHQISVDATLDREPNVPLVTKEALYRIAQEALHNTVKHARATSVLVRLMSGPDGVTLEIRDNGRGFDTTGNYPGHLGLQTMRERATRLGGTLQVKSSPGNGTEIRALLPIQIRTAA
ncbi:MAG TPA: GAF domain-containing protein, partial [Chloroflexota bacterium]